MVGCLESHTGHWVEKLAAERIDLEAVLMIHLLVMGGEARRAFFWGSSSWLMNLGTQ